MSIENEDSIDSVENYLKQSELNDLKQHADKIIQGIRKIDENDANRAIWELFQNAIDLSDDCVVEIGITEKGFQFTHNGKPFTPMTLDCLFKQVSSKTLKEVKVVRDEDDPVGQYGTGFLTTHSFGKQIFIDGGLVKDNGYVKLDRFLIDRDTDSWEILSGKIRNLKIQVGELLKSKEVIPQPFPATTFTFNTNTEHFRKCANRSFESLRELLPLVMTLNKKLSSVVVTALDGSKTVYRKGDVISAETINTTSIFINNEPMEVYWIHSEDKRVIVVLPFSPMRNIIILNRKIPKLFLYYPLIGTEDFGINFVIHSKYFQPTEPRNGLYLKSENADTKAFEKNNRDLIASASNMIFKYIKANASKISNPINLAKISFKVTSDKEILNSYFRELKETWIDEFKILPIVETENENVPISDATFFNEDLLRDEKSFDSIYTLVNMFWKKIPNSNLVKEWTNIIGEWGVLTFTTVGIKELAFEIQKAGIVDIFNKTDLKIFYQYLIDVEQVDIFTKFNLLPNLDGKLLLLSDLNDGNNLPGELVEIAKILMPDVPSKHILPEFKLDLNLPVYTRAQFSSDISGVITAKILDQSDSTTVKPEFRAALIRFCRTSETLDSDSKPVRLIKIAFKFYGSDESIEYLPPIENDEIDYRTAQKRLLRLLLNDINRKESAWVRENVGMLKELIETGCSYKDWADMFKSSAIFPNQLDELTISGDLQVDDGIPESIKDYYDKVLNPGLPVRHYLVHKSMTDFFNDKDKRTVKSLTEKMESRFFDSNVSFIENPHKDTILEIIQVISANSTWEKFFPELTSKRANIMLEMVTDEKTKNDVLSIVKLDAAQINRLGELARNKDFERILTLGHEAFILEQENSALAKLKTKLGTHIEDVIRTGLNNIIQFERIKVDAKNVQDGQDIIISVDTDPIYFVEVKSRWDSKNPVRMSKSQTLKAFDEKDHYALCSIDMSQYVGQDKYDIKDLSQIEHLTYFNIDIGTEVAHLIVTLREEPSQELIQLDGDLRTRIPMKYIEGGINLNSFAENLVLILNRHLRSKGIS